MDEQVKSKMQKLLEYQKTDIDLRKLNNFIRRDEALKNMDKFKSIFEDAKRALQDCERDAGVLVEQFNDLKKYVDENRAFFEQLDGAEGVDEEDVERRVKEFERLKNKFFNAEKKLHDIDDRSKSLTKTREDAIKNGKNAKTKFSEFKDKHTQLVKSKEKDLARLKAELETKRAALDPEFYAEYRKLDADGKFPPIARGVLGDKKDQFNCGGCGLNLSQQGNAKLKEQGWSRCDNCHRIIVYLD